MSEPTICAPCSRCELVPFYEGADWGRLNGPDWHDHCRHVSAMRYCPSCSSNWWRVGLDGDWDIDGCAWKRCPECVEALRCVHCGNPTDDRDRLPSGENFAHAACAMKAEVARRNTETAGARIFADAVSRLTAPRLAPLATAEPEQSVSATAAAIVRGYEEGEQFEEPTVNERLPLAAREG